MDELTGAEVAESPAAEAATPPEAQNPAIPAAQPQPYKGFHEHPDWQRMVQKNRTYEAQNRELAAAVQRLQQQIQGAQPGRPQPTAEQQEALRALRELQGLDPENGKLQQELAALKQQLQGLVQSQQTALTTQGRGQLAAMAKDAGLPATPRALSVIENAVVVYLAENPEAVARFRQGDVSVLRDAFTEFNKDFVSQLRREQTAAVAANKRTLTTQVPPRQAGGQSGAVAPKRLQPGQDPRAFMAEMHRDADAMLQSLRTSQG